MTCLSIVGLVGACIGSLGDKNNSKIGFLLGFFLGPIGWIITAVLPQKISEEEKRKRSELNEIERKKITLLEAQLAELQKNSKQGNLLKQTKQTSDAPPVYRLD